MKILIGVLLALLLALGLTGWQLRVSLQRESTVAQQLVTAQASNKTLEDQNGKLYDRFGSLDNAMLGLNQSQAMNQVELLGRLGTITKIVKETGDTDETVKCFSLPVPAQLDRGLREPAPGGN